MAKRVKGVKDVVYKRTNRKMFKEDDVVSRIQEVMDIVKADTDIISYSSLLLDRDLYRESINYWLKASPDVKALILELREIREARYKEMLLERDNDRNPAMALFYGKTALGLVEQQHKDRLEADSKNSQLDRDTIIEINYINNDSEEE